MNCMRAWVALGIVVLLSGCAGLPQATVKEREEAPAPVIDLGQEPGAVIPHEAPADVSDNRATRTLLAQADQLEAKGELEASAAALERALRIEPKNARLWHRLAVIRLAQGQNSLAANFAAKSNSLAGKDTDLIARNNQLMRDARSP